MQNFAGLPGMRSDPRVRVAVGDQPSPTQFVSKGTGASGRADNIDAKLSENEYVVDAETVALLGDGSPEAGAKKLDAMRRSIRQHKGRALATGRISPDAKASPLQYLADGGPVHPRQPVSMAMDTQDSDFDQWMRLPKQARKIAIPGYERRSRVRVGDVAHNLGPLNQVARLAEGGKVGAFARLFKWAAPVDPNAHLKRMKSILNDALGSQLPRDPPPDVPFEDFARGILAKKDSDILEGK
jgi:hypothetical protein